MNAPCRTGDHEFCQMNLQQAKTDSKMHSISQFAHLTNLLGGLQPERQMLQMKCYGTIIRSN